MLRCTDWDWAWLVESPLTKRLIPSKQCRVHVYVRVGNRVPHCTDWKRGVFSEIPTK